MTSRGPPPTKWKLRRTCDSSLSYFCTVPLLLLVVLHVNEEILIRQTRDAHVLVEIHCFQGDAWDAIEYSEVANTQKISFGMEGIALNKMYIYIFLVS